jgi:polysaccharide deacetylase 2 family uncharacterized protein YibQ
MHDDLTKPLGLAKQDAPSRSWRRLGFAAALGAIVVIAVGGWAVVLLRPQPDAPTAVVTVAREQADPVRTGAIRQETGQDGKSSLQSEAETNIQGSSNAPGGLESPVPNGALIAKLPTPKPRRQEVGLAHMPDPELVEKGAFGIIPKRSADGQRPLDVYSRLPATEGNFGVARIVLIVGGIGISQTGSQDAVRKLPGAVNLAFAPYGNSLGRWMQEARRSGHELLLQVPMQPYDWPQNDPGPRTLLADADASANLANLHWAMSRITNYVGVVNYLGGKMLAQEQSLAPVFNDLSQRGLLFVDDGTMTNSRANEAADAARLPFARADIAIGVASAFPETIDMLAQFASKADKLGIEITPVSAIVSDPERGKKG